MQKLLILSLAGLLFLSTKTMSQHIIAGVVSPGNYYHDFIPDTSIYVRPFHMGGPPDSLDLIFDTHGAHVIRFFNWGDGGLGGGGGECRVSPLTGEAGFRAYLDSSYVWPGEYKYLYVSDTLNMGDTIKSGQNDLFQTQSFFWSSTYGNWSHPTNFTWVDIGDHYLGFSLYLPLDTLCGWIRINVTSENNGYRTTIRDYALNNNPWLGVGPATREAFTLFPNPARETLTVMCSASETGNTLTIQNLTGLTFLCQSIVSEQTTLNISSLSAGIYFMTISGNSPKLVRKFIVNK